MHVTTSLALCLKVHDQSHAVGCSCPYWIRGHIAIVQLYIERRPIWWVMGGGNVPPSINAECKRPNFCLSS